MSLAAPVLAIAAAAAMGFAVTWLRPDLDWRPRAAGLCSAAAAACFVAIWLVMGGGAAILALFAAFGPLVCFDLRRRILPNEITLPLIGVGLVIAAAEGRGGDAALGAALGFGSFWMIGALWRRVRDVEALGLGDAKLLAAIGAFLGAAALPGVVFAAALIGIAYGVIARVVGGGDDIPFAPPLAVGAALAWAIGPLI